MTSDSPTPGLPPPLPTPVPAAGHPAPALAELDFREMVNGAPVWRGALYPDRLRLHPPDGSLPHDVHRPEWTDRAEMIDALLLPRTVSLKLDKKRLFRLDAPGFAALGDWVGQPQLLRAALQRRLGWMLPIALIFVIASLPIGNDDPPGARKPFDPVWLGMGIAIAFIWLLWKLRPHPVLFLLDSAWLLVLAADTAMRLWRGWSWPWFVLLLLQISLTLSGVRLYARFRGTRLGEPGADDPQPAAGPSGMSGSPPL